MIDFSPRDLRTLDSLADDLSRGRVALLIGAGADVALAKAASWDALLRRLFPRRGAPSSSLRSSWPIEMATVARQYLGDREFFRRIDESIQKRSRRRRWLEEAFENLADCVPLIVTTNYSDTLYRAISGGRKQIHPRVVDRTVLRGVRLPQPGEPFEQPLLVHIHGRRDELVLDRFGYDDAEYGDPFYEHFFLDLFERWSVLVIGSSFMDPPLRLAASQARRLRPELRRSHVWIDAGTDRIYRWKSRAAFLAYSLRRIEVPDHAHVAKTVEQVSIQEPLDVELGWKAVAEGDLDSFADMLDHSGDFESVFQKSLFEDPAEAVGLAGKLQSGAFHIRTVARIERHLRHHLYLVQPRDRATELRQQLWTSIARRMMARKADRNAIYGDARLHFDFLVGYYEVGIDPKLDSRVLLEAKPSDPTLRRRFRRARELWRPLPKTTHDTIASLRRWAADVGWEAFEAKLALDEARVLAGALNGDREVIGARDIDQVLQAAGAAVRAAQYAGGPRRVLGALILQSLWMISRAESRAVIRGAITLAEQIPLERTLRAGLGWAWRRHFDRHKDAFDEIGWYGVKRPTVKDLKGQQRYFEPVCPPWRLSTDG